MPIEKKHEGVMNQPFKLEVETMRLRRDQDWGKDQEKTRTCPWLLAGPAGLASFPAAIVMESWDTTHVCACVRAFSFIDIDFAPPGGR